MKKAAKKISDKELKALLATLKEEVAAPPNFRARVLSHLGLVRLEKKAPSTFWKPLWVASTAAALVVLGLGFWFNLKPQQTVQPQVQAKAPLESELASQRALRMQTATQLVAAHATRKPVHFAQTSKVVAPPEAAPEVEVASSLPATKPLAVGAPADTAGSTARLASGGEALTGPQVPQFSSGGGVGAAAPVTKAMAKFGSLTTLTPDSTPVHDANPLVGNSQVRRNKFRAADNEYAAILYQLKEQESVRIEVYDRLGHRVALLQDSSQAAGSYEIHWFGHDDNNEPLPSGIYLVRVKTDHYDERHKVVFIR